MNGVRVQEQAETEAEARAAIAKIKKAILWSAFVSTPAMIAVAWYAEVDTWIWVVVGAIAAYEVVSYPFVMRMLDRSLEARIDEIRKEQGLTPAGELPDVGV